MVIYRFFSPGGTPGHLTLASLTEALQRIRHDEASQTAHAYELVDESGHTLLRPEIDRLLAATPAQPQPAAAPPAAAPAPAEAGQS